MMNLKPGMEVLNLKHKTKETIVGTCKIKTEKGWKEGVVYMGVDRYTGRLEMFSRERMDFEKDFIVAMERSDAPLKIPVDALLKFSAQENKDLKGVIKNLNNEIRKLEAYIDSDQYKLDKAQKQAMRKEENYKILLDCDKELRRKNKELSTKYSDALCRLRVADLRIKEFQERLEETLAAIHKSQMDCLQNVCQD